MKRSITRIGLLIVLTAISYCSAEAQWNPFTQPYEAMSFQGVARDANGAPLPNQSISVRLSVLFGAGSAYDEIHSTVTDDRGLFTLVIGAGTYVSGAFPSFEEIVFRDGLPWALHLSADFTGGTNYQSLGGPQVIRGVPFANHARAASTLIDSAWAVSTVIGQEKVWAGAAYKVGIGTSDPETKLDITGNVRIADVGNTNGTDPSAALEIASTTGAVLLPRLSTANRDALTPTPGMIIFNEVERKFQGYYSDPETELAAGAGSNGSLSILYHSSAPCIACASRGVAQVFQPAYSGTLDSLKIDLLGISSQTGPPALKLTFSVYEGTPTSAGATLASTTITYSPSEPDGTKSIGFDPAPELNAGQTYTFLVDHADLDVNVGVGIAVNTTGTYGAGAAWTRELAGAGSANPCCDMVENVNTDVIFQLISVTTGSGWVDLH